MNRRIPRSMIDALPRAMKSLALANAPPSIKQSAALVPVAENGNGVIELIDELISDDLRRLEGSLSQNLISLGKRTDGTTVQLSPYGHNMLVAGPSGCGKSTLTAGIIERLIEKDYQVCVIDPEGDYGTLRDVVALGTSGLTEITARFGPSVLQADGSLNRRAMRERIFASTDDRHVLELFRTSTSVSHHASFRTSVQIY